MYSVHLSSTGWLGWDGPMGREVYFRSVYEVLLSVVDCS